jgi:hypothetical protein
VSGFSEAKEEGDIIYPRFKIVPGHLPDLPKVPRVRAEDPLDDDCEALIGLIQTQKKDMSRDDVEKMIQAEVKNSGGMFGRKTAAILVARSLGIDLEKSGSPVST